MDIPKNAATPPVIGEYAYYDQRISRLEDKSKIEEWNVSCDSNPEIVRQAHYSLPSKDGTQILVACHGKITCVEKKIQCEHSIVQNIIEFVFPFWR